MFNSEQLSTIRNILIFCISVAIGIHAAAAYAMYDQGDFARIISRVLGAPVPVSDGFPATLWHHSAGQPIPNPSSGSASFLFAVVALIQRALSPLFHLEYWSIFARTAFALSMIFFARSLLREKGAGSWALLSLGLFALLIGFAPHNTAVFQSFYPEQVAFIALPVLCATLGFSGRWRLPFFVISLLAISTAKAQYFYLPALVFMVLASFPASRPANLKFLALICVIAQLIAALPLMRNSYMDINRYNATYFGTYLELTPAEASRLGIRKMQLDCAGTDWWGNRVASPTDVDAESGDPTCSTRNAVSEKAVLIPYIRVPTLLPRMILKTLEAHWTTRYFHLDKDVRYVRERKSDRDVLRTWMASLDTAVSWLAVGPLAVFVLLSSVVLFLIQTVRDRGRTTGTVAFLVALISSQLIVCLVGEGFRDLSKHLMLCLFSLELLSVTLLGFMLDKRF